MNESEKSLCFKKSMQEISYCKTINIMSTSVNFQAFLYDVLPFFALNYVDIIFMLSDLIDDSISYLHSPQL